VNRATRLGLARIGYPAIAVTILGFVIPG